MHPFRQWRVILLFLNRYSRIVPPYGKYQPIIVPNQIPVWRRPLQFHNIYNNHNCLQQYSPRRTPPDHHHDRIDIIMTWTEMKHYCTNHHNQYCCRAVPWPEYGTGICHLKPILVPIIIILMIRHNNSIRRHTHRMRMVVIFMMSLIRHHH